MNARSVVPSLRLFGTFLFSDFASRVLLLLACKSRHFALHTLFVKRGDYRVGRKGFTSVKKIMK